MMVAVIVKVGENTRDNKGRPDHEPERVERLRLSTFSTKLGALFGSLFPISLTFLLDFHFTFPPAFLPAFSLTATTSGNCTCIDSFTALCHIDTINAMGAMTRNQKDEDEAALILLQMADPDWELSSSEKEMKDNDTEQEPADLTEQSMVDAKSPASNDRAAVVDFTSASESASAPSTPSSTSTFSVKGASFAEIDAHQQTIQQTRAALTAQQRASLKLKPYSHYDLEGKEIGILWQTRAEHRTFRQTQRRRGAKLVRAGTTNGMKLPRQR